MTISQAANKRATILVVDDAPDNLELICSLLTDSYRVKVACSGEKALDITSSSPLPDLILLDIMMPGMDGYEVCRRLKASAATVDIPVIFLTAKSETTDETHGFELGAADYITKPISPPTLLARIRTHLSLKDAADLLRNKNDYLEREVVRRTRELTEAYELNRQIVTCAQEGIIVHDPELRYLVWNPYMEQLTGVAATEVIGRSPLEIAAATQESGVIADLEKALAGEVVTVGELPFTAPATGRSGWTCTTMAPLRNLAGEITGIIRTVSDITGRKEIEEQLRQAQKMEVIGQLASGVAHDFNNIISVIIGYGELLRMDQTLNARQTEKLEQIIAAAERAAQLTGGLLTFSRKQIAAPKLENISSIVQQFQKFLARILGEDIRIRLHLAEEPLTAMVNRGQIEQILLNLASNARDAMPGGGQLTITATRRSIESRLVTPHGSCEPGCYVCIEVADTGCGMSPEICSRLFEPFFTTKEPGKGTGLGMAIIYGIVQQHGGSIMVASKPGHGSTVTIFIPLAEERPVGREEATATALPPRGEETILLAEDDDCLRTLATDLLTMFGYRVIAASDGQDAVEKFTQSRDMISLILMDLVMPRMNGIEAAKEIRRLDPEPKIIYWSGYAGEFARDHGLDEQEAKIIAKPIQPQQLLRIVRETLDGCTEQPGA